MSYPFDEFSKMVRDLDQQWINRQAAAKSVSPAPAPTGVMQRFKADSFTSRCRLASRFVKLAWGVMFHGQVTIKLTPQQDSDNLT